MSFRHKRAVFPHSRAMAALVQAFAHQNLDKAFELYCQLQQDSAGAAAVTLSDRFMWQSLIEAACRKARLDIALQVHSLRIHVHELPCVAHSLPQIFETQDLLDVLSTVVAALDDILSCSLPSLHPFCTPLPCCSYCARAFILLLQKSKFKLN